MSQCVDKFGDVCLFARDKSGEQGWSQVFVDSVSLNSAARSSSSGGDTRQEWWNGKERKGNDKRSRWFYLFELFQELSGVIGWWGIPWCL